MREKLTSKTECTCADVRRLAIMCSAILLPHRSDIGCASPDRRATRRERSPHLHVVRPSSAGPGCPTRSGARRGAEEADGCPVLVTRPAMPVPWIREMSTSCSLAILRTTGDERRRRRCSTESEACVASCWAASAGSTDWNRLGPLIVWPPPDLSSDPPWAQWLRGPSATWRRPPLSSGTITATTLCTGTVSPSWSRESR